MTRYLTSFEISNFKNSLKSGGSRMVAIDDLPHQLESFQTLLRRLGAPELPFFGIIADRADLKG